MRGGDPTTEIKPDSTNHLIFVRDVGEDENKKLCTSHK